jgi:GAF domain-containing protein
MAGVQLCALFLLPSHATWTVAGSRTSLCRLFSCDGLLARSASQVFAPWPADRFASPAPRKAGIPMPIDPTELAKSIGALGSLDPERGLAPTLQQIADAAKQLFSADAAGLMLVDAEGQLRWASASDQSAQTLEDGQERLAQGPCAVAFSQRLPAAIRNLQLEPDWAEFTQVLVSEGICAALSVPVELDGGVIGTLDIYAREARDWDPSEVAALQAYAGLVASLLAAATTAQVKGRLADQLGAALEHRWLIEQAKGVVMGREQLDAQAAFERLRGAARSSTRRLADVAREVTDGQPLPTDRRKLAKARAGQAKDRETAT